MGALAGWGRAYKTYQKSKQASKALEASKKTDKLQFPVIKSVPVSKTVTKEGAEASVKKVKSAAYIKNIDEVNKHQQHVKRGERAKEKLKDMVDTKRAYWIRSHKKQTDPRRIHPRDPGKKRQIGGD